MRGTIAKRLRKHSIATGDLHLYKEAKRLWNRVPRPKRGELHQGFRAYDSKFGRP